MAGLSEGASLIVFYTHPSIPINAQIYMNLGSNESVVALLFSSEPYGQDTAQ